MFLLGHSVYYRG